jgi:hypothetical protein
MPISYALFLGIPIGVFFYFIGKVILRTMFGHFESQERRSSLVFSAFGLLLVPTIWTTGVIQEEFPDRGGVVISFGVLLIEGLIMAKLVKRFYAGRGSSDSMKIDR